VYAEIIKRGYHHKGYDVYEYGWDFNYIENKSTNSMLYEDEINEAVKKLEQDENAPVTDDLNKLISIVSSEVNKVVNERKDDDSNQQEGATTMSVSKAIEKAEGFIGELNNSPYKKQGNQFVLKTGTPVLDALKIITDRGHNPQVRSDGEDYDG